MKWLIDKDDQGYEVEFDLKDYPESQLLSDALDGDMEAQAELDRRATAEVIADMKKAGYKQSEIDEIVKADASLPKAVEPEIVKVYRNAIDRAIERLNQMPDDEEGKLRVPWPQADRPKIPTDDWGDAPLRSFRIDELTATQPFVRRDTIIWHLEHLNDSAADNKSMPNVVVDGEHNLIYDGHHRLVALWLLGADSANCWKVEI